MRDRLSVGLLEVAIVILAIVILGLNVIRLAPVMVSADRGSAHASSPDSVRGGVTP